MGAAKELSEVFIPGPVRRCSNCGQAKMEGRAPNATRCLDCAGGRRQIRSGKRAYHTKVATLPVAR